MTDALASVAVRRCPAISGNPCYNFRVKLDHYLFFTLACVIWKLACLFFTLACVIWKLARPLFTVAYIVFEGCSLLPNPAQVRCYRRRL